MAGATNSPNIPAENRNAPSITRRLRIVIVVSLGVSRRNKNRMQADPAQHFDASDKTLGPGSLCEPGPSGYEGCD